MKTGTPDEVRAYNRGQYRKHEAKRRQRRRERYWASPEGERAYALAYYHAARAILVP
jgi:hypothetical protein